MRMKSGGKAAVADGSTAAGGGSGLRRTIEDEVDVALAAAENVRTATSSSSMSINMKLITNKASAHDVTHAQCNILCMSSTF